ncbi:lipoate--protein ligase family protein [Rhabdothermincola salaria]|uniref:lipoate--protein ligase family protein n=1 Tax=Rhabdothermincola salaria TaxID=2903142 RepID=UPI001E33C8D8|nr:hypothetical protein [Rhabdothermincola salaria]MCD9622467.1 hypothetical protein [Rhabdothermincola salaria]
MTGRWSIEQLAGAAGPFHGRDPSDPPRREMWVFTVDRPALVLGSTQPATDVDTGAAERLGVDVVRRRSGGGAVLLDPGAVVWVDAVVPRDDELWHDDVGRAFAWLGQLWARVLGDLGVPPDQVAVHEAGLVTTPLSPVVCFAGLGPGEVTVGGAKAVGISQRRTRSTARLQSSVLLSWDAERQVALLAPGLARVAGSAGARHLRDLPVAPMTTSTTTDVVDAVLARLPS